MAKTKRQSIELPENYHIHPKRVEWYLNQFRMLDDWCRDLRSCSCSVIKDFSGWVSEKREELNFSQRDLAARSGVSQATISKIEGGGAADVKFVAILDVARALGLGIGTIVMPPPHVRDDDFE